MLETTHNTHYFDDSDAYHEATKRLNPYGKSQAIGVKHPDGSSEIFINCAYYLGYGQILHEQLRALIIHEETELACPDESQDAHYIATVAEYQWIYDAFGAEGEKGLLVYHEKLKTLMGAIGADARNSALIAVLGDNPYAVKR